MKLRFWLSRREREERELDEEMRFHLEQEARLLAERGQSDEAARRQAQRDFGNLTLATEVTRGMWISHAWERSIQDLRFAARLLWKSPGFTAVALTALALGIGATTAIFSVTHSVLLKPLPFPHPERLVAVWESGPSGKTNLAQTQNFLDLRRDNRSFDGIAAIEALPANLEADGDAVQVPGVRVTAGFFEILGTQPLLGRSIRAEDDRYKAPSVAVLSYGLWQRRFGGRPDVLGSKVTLNGARNEVIGVMPPGFAHPTIRADIYIPMQINPATAPIEGRNLQMVARLRQDASLRAAQADLRATFARVAAERPAMNAKVSAIALSLMEQTVGDVRTALLVMLGAVGFVMLIACANVSNLLLMRAAGRRREMTVRAALGAGRWRLVQQLVVESGLLALLGGGLGCLVAWWGVPAIVHMLPADFPLPRMAEIAVDRTALWFTLGVSLVCGLIFGIVPALQLGPIGDGLRGGGRSGSGANRGVRAFLVISEVALAMLLVTGAGLMLRSFVLLRGVDPGFRPERLLTVRMLLTPGFSSYEQLLDRRAGMVQAMLEQIRTLPQVSSASSIHMLPLRGQNSGSWYDRADRPLPPPGQRNGGDVSVVSDGYFRTMGIPMVAGREFDAHDRKGAPLVAVLNQTAAQILFPGEDRIGKRLRVAWGMGPGEMEIVGVAADIHQRGLDEESKPCLFLPAAQQPSAFLNLVIRTTASPAALVPAARERIRAAAPRQGVEVTQTMESVLADSIARPALDMAVMTIFGAVALLLACVGIYSVISYSVQQRAREMGIRLALGAAPGAIRKMVFGEGLGLASAGIVVGLIAARVMTKWMATLLYTVKPTDPAVYATVCAVLVCAAAAGCWLPAHRATQVDPAVTLREE